MSAKADVDAALNDLQLSMKQALDVLMCHGSTPGQDVRHYTDTMAGVHKIRQWANV